MDGRFGLALTLLLGGTTELLACATELPPSPVALLAEAPDDVTRAATVARAIKADPEHAADALAAAGMTEEELDALLFDIAGDPTKSEAYAKALGVDDAGAEGAGAEAPAAAQNE